MIIGASRRTDIPAYYFDWLLERLKEQFVLVRNPMNQRQVSRVSLKPELVDGIVFWSKNPEPVLKKLKQLDGYVYYFQFTLNAYDTDIEAALPSLQQRLDTFGRLAEAVGTERVLWRYDPILLNSRYDLAYHKEAFAHLAERLAGSTEKCIISFLDCYPKINKRLAASQIRPPSAAEQRELAGQFAVTAQKYALKLATCAESIELADLGISHASCVDAALLARLGSGRLTAAKDKNQRSECGCVESIDIGAYDTCLHGCSYCYANHSMPGIVKKHALFNVHAPLLCSSLQAEDKLTERKVYSLLAGQQELF
ncbi:DUF1848 domain-containing protein [uncultured Phascolarctobacterium sp.]|uniref:DUF1848 domain-containing protein n=1 Tax=uncultured Phascolarctobacterium sp. TaxID=512296 RepID=UPI0015AB7064|nr:DUF1848 domain-containing protein [uncultured Phascolarctobacterium sp.]